jgi:hypothetical protein
LKKRLYYEDNIPKIIQLFNLTFIGLFLEENIPIGCSHLYLFIFIIIFYINPFFKVFTFPQKKD